jgi:hypothetical protein
MRLRRQRSSEVFHVQSLAEVQAAFARAMTTGDAERLDAALVGGTSPRKRLAVHLRHYEASLTSALLEKFPACAWLVGGALVRAAARAYVRLHPPQQPCIAEYGREFPQFLGSYGGTAASLPYLESFARLEWAYAQASIAIEAPPCSWARLASVGPDRLLDATLALQPGLRYVHSRWRIDELMTTFLRGAEPERFVLVELLTLMEVRGARGAVSLQRLDRASFAFRTALADGGCIGAAATAALESDGAFDTGEALKSLAHAGLVTGVSLTSREPAAS